MKNRWIGNEHRYLDDSLCDVFSNGKKRKMIILEIVFVLVAILHSFFIGEVSPVIFYVFLLILYSNFHIIYRGLKNYNRKKNFLNGLQSQSSRKILSESIAQLPSMERLCFPNPLFDSVTFLHDVDIYLSLRDALWYKRIKVMESRRFFLVAYSIILLFWVFFGFHFYFIENKCERIDMVLLPSLIIWILTLMVDLLLNLQRISIFSFRTKRFAKV